MDWRAWWFVAAAAGVVAPGRGGRRGSSAGGYMGDIEPFLDRHSGKERGSNHLLPSLSECSHRREPRILFGSNAALNEYPWMALLGSKKQSHLKWFCGGSLINDRYVLTAAHCLLKEKPEETAKLKKVLRIRLGEHNLATNPDCSATKRPCSPCPQDYSAEETTLHKNYTRGNHRNDIALIRLDRKVNLGGTVQPVCLPSSGLDVEEFLRGSDAVVAGWGALENNSFPVILQSVEVPLANRTICIMNYGELIEGQVCFGGRGRQDSCAGDSGGPVFQTDPRYHRYHIVLGVVSRGMRICGMKDVPGVYTNVSYYINWIKDRLKP